jgi:hypothetical protein
VGADPECERENRDGGECGIVPEQAQSVSDIVRGAVKERHCVHAIDLFTDERAVSEFAARGTDSFLACRERCSHRFRSADRSRFPARVRDPNARGGKTV